MVLRSPKEMVNEIAGSKEDRNQSIFALKSKSTLNGAFYGGALGFLLAMHKGQNMYAYSLGGAVFGGLICNILTVKK